MTGSKTLSLGWLLPYSGIFTNLKNDLQQGLGSAWHQAGAHFDVRVFPEFIETGSLKDTEKALNKLLHFEQVDLVIGVLSSKVAVGILPMLEKSRTPMILLNLGADIPVIGLSSDYLFYNSLHLWKSEWAIGRWAQKNYGGEPSINLSVYEAGYGMHESFKAGAAASGAESVKLNIVRNFTGTPDTSPLIQYLGAQRPPHAHALLSGLEGQQFLQLFRDQGLSSSTQLTVNPFMAEDGILPAIPDGLALYNAMTWSLSLDSPCNKAFTDLYSHNYGKAPHVFDLLAFEAGLALLAATRELSGRFSRDALVNILGQVQPNGPRGKINLSTRPLQTNLPVYIRLPTQSSLTGLPENRIIQTTTGLEWNDPALPGENNYLSGWQNPYLCV